MTIQVKIGAEEATQEGPKLNLIARKSIDGNIMIMDHKEIDIVVIPSKKQVITFPKKSFQDSVYSVQDRLFNFLSTKGVITRESVKAGNVFGSIQGEYPEPLQGLNATQLVVFSIGKFMEEERPHMEFEEYMKDENEERLTEPGDEDSTELGEVPQKARQGSLPKYMDAYKSRRYYVGGVY